MIGNFIVALLYVPVNAVISGKSLDSIASYRV